MKKFFAALAVVALSSGFAKAQDKGTEFKWGGELRQRYSLTNNPTFVDSGGSTEQHWSQRNMLHVNAISSDKLQAYFGLVHTAIWGDSGLAAGTDQTSAGQAIGIPSTTAPSRSNSLQVNEAWLWWKVSDQFMTKSGRMSHTYGDGLLMSKNDWEANPTRVEGLMGRFSWEFLDLDLHGGKLFDAGVTSANDAVPTAGTATTDTEAVFYGLYGSFKMLPDFLKNADVFIVQLNGDQGVGGGTFAPSVNTAAGAPANGSWGLTTYGLRAKGEFAMVDYRLDAAFQSGKQKAGTGTNNTDTTFSGNMFDVELGINFPEFMKGRLFVNYHMDSGDDPGTGVRTENKQYQPLLWDSHEYAGKMDVFGFGNLTDIRIGLTLQPGEDTWVGVEANLLSRTSDKAQPTTLTTSGHVPVPTAMSLTGNSEKALGTEIDLWAKHNYGHGFSMLAGVNYLTLGQFYKATGTPTKGSAMQFVAQAQYNF